MQLLQEIVNRQDIYAIKMITSVPRINTNHPVYVNFFIFIE